MNKIIREQGRLWQNIIGDQNDADFNTIRRVLSQLIDALVADKPEPEECAIDYDNDPEFVLDYLASKLIEDVLVMRRRIPVTPSVNKCLSTVMGHLWGNMGVTDNDEPKPEEPPIVISRKPSAPYTQERAGYIPGIGGTCPYCGCDGMTVVDDKAVCWDCFLIMLWPPDKDEDKPEEPLLRNCIPDDPARQHDEPPAQPNEWREGDYAWWNDTYTAADGYKPPCLVCLVKQYGDAWETTNGGYLYESSLTVPTARHLAKKIGEDEGGNDILAWACSCAGKGHVVVVFKEPGVELYEQYRSDFEATAMGIPIVTADQRKRHFPEFPPELLGEEK